MMKLPEMDLDLDFLGIELGGAEELTRRPVLVADSIVGGDSNVALAIRIRDAQPRIQTQQGQQSQQGQQAPAARGQGTGTQSATAGTAGRSARDASGTTGTSGSAGAPLTDSSALSGADSGMVGRHVDIDRVKVLRVDQDHGFWIETGGQSIFVLPADRQQGTARQGQMVSVDGIILEMPRRLRAKAREGNANDTIYIYAQRVN